MARIARCACLLLLVVFLTGRFAGAQERRGSISGHATDSNNDPLVGARVEVQPTGREVVTDAQGAFVIADVAPGSYTLNISYVGFTTLSMPVTVAAGAAAKVDAVLQVESQNQQVIVRGER